MILAVRTDSPIAELFLYEEGETPLFSFSQELGRQMAKELPGAILALCDEAGIAIEGITGIILFSGPGSFTGLRIGAATVNAMSYGLGVPVVAENGLSWAHNGLQRLRDGEDDKLALPFYGADAHVTQPRK